MSKFKKFLYATDNHGKLICEATCKVLIDFCKEWKPDYKVHGGDIWDFTPLRSKASQEERAEGISDDYQAGWAFLDAFRPTHITLGNHDDRLWQNMTKCADGILAERCRELAEKTEDEFRKRRIQWIDYDVDSYIRLPEGGPKFIHGFRSTTYPAKAHFENWGDCVHGHVHKPDEYRARHIDGGKAFSVGCIGDIKKMEYAKRTPARLGWRNGFLYGIINTKTGAWDAWQSIKTKEGVWNSLHGLL